MCKSQTFSSVEFLLIKLLSVSVIRKTMRNAARGGREVPILSFLCRAAFGLCRPPGLREAGFYPILAKERKRWRAKSQGWGKCVARSSSGDFQAKLALLRYKLHPLLPRQPLASDISVKRYPEPPLLPPPPFSSLCPFFFPPLLSPYMWIVRKWLETMCQFAALYTEALFSSPLTREWLRVVLLYKDSQRKELLFYPITQEWATGKQLVPCSQLPLRLQWGNH